jgi:hypothetical protein
VPVAVATTEEEELCEKEIHSEWSLATEKSGLDKPRFLNAPVGSFGWWGGAAWSHHPLGPCH